jgi:hypothetical protein
VKSYEEWESYSHRKIYGVWLDQLYKPKPMKDEVGDLLGYDRYARHLYDLERDENKKMGSKPDDWGGNTILPATREPGYWLNMDVRVSWEIGPGQKESDKKKKFGNDRLVYFWRVFAGAEAETRDQKKVIFEGVSRSMSQAEAECKAAVKQTERLVTMNRQGSTGMLLADEGEDDDGFDEVVEDLDDVEVV